MALALRLYSPEGLQACFEAVIEQGVPPDMSMVSRRYPVIKPVIRFLQGRDPVATHIVRSDWLPRPRFAACDLDLEPQPLALREVTTMPAGWLPCSQDLADCFLHPSPHFGLTSYGAWQNQLSALMP